MHPELEDPICCVCVRPIEGSVSTTPDGRAHHADCDPAPPPPEATRRKPSRTLEQKIRTAMHGKGTRTLDEDAAGSQ